MQNPDYKEQQRQQKEAFKEKRIAAVGAELSAAGINWRQGGDGNHFYFSLPYGKAETWATTGTWIITDESLSVTMDYTRQKGVGVRSLVLASRSTPQQLAYKIRDILKERKMAQAYEHTRESNAAYPWIARCINAGADLALTAKLSQMALDDNKTLLHVLARADRNGLNPEHVSDAIAAMQKLLGARDDNGLPLFDVNAQDEELGFTPLHYAVEISTSSLTRFLLEAGADPFIKAGTVNGWTPYQCAIDCKRDDVLQMMDVLRARAAIQGVLSAIPAPATP